MRVRVPGNKVPGKEFPGGKYHRAEACLKNEG